ncbi:3-deoxy-D-manno-octulosonic acid transferase [Desulfobulbus sp.]|uniref:3-deoxy-D-manno-octulosonic acid transferase n=1 Tax=Desulfobulbus sp. TaxID=895 RepID=UPI00286F6D57|nr:3-deoxy-D-manno-octulosonic acid transferase [Desulfobulbus sp.]
MLVSTRKICTTLIEGYRLPMLLLYPLFTTILALALLPILISLACRKKYRGRIGKRLGWGLAAQMAWLPSAKGPTLWIHALSVGEVTSAVPLVRGLRVAHPQARILFSVTTGAGDEVARKLLAPHVDLILAAPVDVGWVVPYFTRVIRPDLFLLVETDFWWHWLRCLRRRQIPTVLVNGRISAASMTRYRRFSRFFLPMFRSFSLLAMQTAADAAQMVALGVETDKVVTLGNLKFDTSLLSGAAINHGALAIQKERYGFAVAPPLWVCGSTHRGEEAILFRVYRRLLTRIADLQLVLAPRNIERAEEIVELAGGHGLVCRRWSLDPQKQESLLILDTIGELAGCYAMAEVAFVGGSLVASGGHNPIEPAAAAVPALFGPHMEDFAEIAAELIRCGGAGQVDSEDSLYNLLHQLLIDREQRRSMSEAARACVVANRGVVRRHLEAIAPLLSGMSPSPWKG